MTLIETFKKSHRFLCEEKVSKIFNTRNDFLFCNLLEIHRNEMNVGICLMCMFPL